MYGRPAGYSDDDEDEGDDYDDFDDYRPRWRPNVLVRTPTNGGPKNVDEAIIQKDLVALTKLVSAAISKGSSSRLNVPTESQCPPLFLACCYGFTEGVQLLLENGADPNVHKGLHTPLMTCCSDGGNFTEEKRVACVRLLLKHGADVNATDRHGKTALMFAATYNFILVVKELLECPGIDVNLKYPAGWTALFFAMEGGHIELSEILVEAGCDRNHKDVHDKTADYYLKSALDDVTSDAYVSALFQDVTVSQEYVVRTKDTSNEPVTRFLSQLPNEDGDGGFPESVWDIMVAAGCQKIDLPINTSLAQILSGSDEELIRLGVSLGPQRRQILNAVHNYHIAPWRTSSLTQNTKSPLRFEEAINVCGAILKHLVTMNTALEYLQGRVFRSEKMPCGRMDLMKVLIQIRSSQSLLRKRLIVLLGHYYKVADIGENPPGYVGSSLLRRQRLRFSYIAAAAVMATSFYFFFKRCWIYS